MGNIVAKGRRHRRFIQTRNVQQFTHKQPMPDSTHSTRKMSLPIIESPQAHDYSFIPDHFKTVEQITTALREAGLESSNLIVGIDFTKSNEWTGKQSFNGQSLHAIGSIPNPYEQAISIIGRTLSPFDEDNLIPCFGFGDASTHDSNVFSFYEDHRPCHGFEEALERYREIVPHLSLAGPTSYAAIIEAAMGIVENSHGQYHVLIIIADGQVTRGSNVGPDQLSPQEKKTVDAIVASSQYALSIILVGVGDGPWETMQQFDDKIPRRAFDNFQFVNFTKIMSRNLEQSEKEAAFALAALMEVPFQYKATIKFNILGRQVGKAPNIVPLPPPLSLIAREASHSGFHQSTFPQSQASLSKSPAGNSGPETGLDSERQVCPVCLTNPRDMAFGCGHQTCRECSQKLSNCPVCRVHITTRLRLYGI